MIANIDINTFDNEWREANMMYLKCKADGIIGEDLDFYRSIALLRAQIRSVAYIYKSGNNK